MSLRIFMLVRELETGTLVYSENMIRELERNGAEVLVGYTGKRPPLSRRMIRLDEAIPPAIDRNYVTQAFRFLFVLKSMKENVRPFRPHVIFAQGIDEDGFIAILASVLFRVPAISFVHDLTLLELRLNRPGGLVPLWQAASLLRQCVAAAHLNAVLVGSEFMKRVLANMFRIAPTATGLGVDQKFKNLSGDRANTPFRVLFIGNLTRKKRQEIPLKAASQLRDLNVELTYVGSGPEMKTLVELRDALGLNERVSFLGRLKDEVMIDVLRRVHVCLVPSLWEGFGLAAAEAVASGVPVLATDSGGLREVIKHGYNGFLVPIGRDDLWAGYIRNLYQDRELYARLAANCVVKAKDFDWKETCKKTLEIIKSVIVTSQ